MTAKASNPRPAWTGMGWWKWLSILLVSCCLLMIGPYAYTGGGGSNNLDKSAQRADLNGCPLDYHLRVEDKTVTLSGRLAPHCATALLAPTVRAVDAQNRIVVESPLRGGPNSLRGRIELPVDAAGHLKLLVISAAADGLTIHADITAGLLVLTNEQSAN